jgi:hypothetical protein
MKHRNIALRELRQRCKVVKCGLRGTVCGGITVTEVFSDKKQKAADGRLFSASLQTIGKRFR